MFKEIERYSIPGIFDYGILSKVDSPSTYLWISRNNRPSTAISFTQLRAAREQIHEYALEELNKRLRELQNQERILIQSISALTGDVWNLGRFRSDDPEGI